MSTPEPFEVYAIRYANHMRKASENFLGGDPHDGPMPIDYFIWAIVGKSGTFILDTGFGQTSADKRGRKLLNPPAPGDRPGMLEMPKPKPPLLMFSPLPPKVP